ncbi:MAG: penicillin-binding protein 1B [Granulosicoccus sp.]|nr:penicillin-binding protein 1B [Granulosicoccus sp.]
MSFRSSAIKILKSGRVRLVARLLLLILVIAGTWFSIWLYQLDQQIVARMSSRQWALPARVYARPLELYAGKQLSKSDLITELEWLGYQAADSDLPGHFWVDNETLRVSTRGFDFADSTEPPLYLQVTLQDNSLGALQLLQRPELDIDTTATDAEQELYAESLKEPLPERETESLPITNTDGVETLSQVRLEPLEIGAIHADRHEDRTLVSVDGMPKGFVETLAAVEDRQFFDHHGVSLRGILRAAWVNFRAGSKRQGASTLTQQLVKNLFLTNEKSWSRKFTEAWMAIVMEFRYDKETIIETFANEVFISQDGDRAIHGFGLASQYFFGRPLRELKPHQYALLVGMLKAPTSYNPVRHPDRARTRRNLVLSLMHDAQVLDDSDYTTAIALDLGVDAKFRGGGNPAYLDTVKRQLLEDYAAEDLQNEGLRIFTNYDPLVQQALENSVNSSLNQLSNRFGETALPEDFLEAAAVVTDPNTGEVRAMMGGRQSRYAGFNRAVDARRPVGSLLKPAIFLTALQQPERFTLATLIRDETIEIEQQDGSLWTPENYDGKVNGDVTLLEALTRSLNLASINLGLELGLPAIIDSLHELGIEQVLPENPSLLLGAKGFSVLEMTQFYQTLAADGFSVPPRTIRDVLDADNNSLSHFPLNISRKIDNNTMHLMKFAMTETMRIGTGRSTYATLDPTLTVAGKTGTSDGQRDSWFAGFSGDQLAVIWLGNDLNAETPLTGSSGALQVWTKLMDQISHEAINYPRPEAIFYQATDLKTGRRVRGRCESALQIPFVSGSEPRNRTRCARPSNKSWIKSLFGNE